MTHTQLLKTFELIETKFENLTKERIEELEVSGFYTILEEAVDECFGIDKHSRDDFWKSINSVHGSNERPDLANLSYQLIDKFYLAKFTSWRQRKR